MADAHRWKTGGRRGLTAMESSNSQTGVGQVLGVPLVLTDYDAFGRRCLALAREPGPRAVEFANTQVVVLRRHDAWFRQVTDAFDFFIPDGMPLIWCLNARGAGLKDRVYGPTFMRRFMLASPASHTHYFLGGSPACLERLAKAFTEQNPNLRIVGSRSPTVRLGGADGREVQFEQEEEILEEINRLSPDFLWVGLGAPKQEAWLSRYKSRIQRGIIFTVGFAFDVNAGLKPDAPDWMQRRGLTWLYRLASEPRRLAGRYLTYNSLFLAYLLWDGLRGRACMVLRAASKPPR